jgi:hypothetical protein
LTSGYRPFTAVALAAIALTCGMVKGLSASMRLN